MPYAWREYCCTQGEERDTRCGMRSRTSPISASKDRAAAAAREQAAPSGAASSPRPGPAPPPPAKAVPRGHAG
eukprot:3073316-Pyramimonas_sp.AAC.1